jgi:hypothetical protein
VDGGFEERRRALGGQFKFPNGHAPKEYATLDPCTTDVRPVPLPGNQDVLADILRQGAQQLLTPAIAAEVAVQNTLS